jgi:hypothetical protein
VLRLFAVVNLFGFLLQGHRFAMLVPEVGVIPHVLVWLAILAEFATLAAAIGLALYALGGTNLGLRMLPLAAPLLFAIAHAFLFVDATLYSLFRFHFNGLALEVLFTPGGFQTMEIPSRELMRFTVAFALLIAAEALLLQLLARYWLRKHPAAVVPGRWKRWLVAWIVLLAADRALGATADLADITDAARASAVVPFYRPFAVKQILATVMGWPQSSDRVLLAAGQKMGRYLLYPRAPLVFEPPSSLPDIVWIVIESWRGDMFDPNVTPEIVRLGRESLVFTRHVSGGNHTRFGLFSLFSGLHGPYWHASFAEQSGSLLFDRLKQLGYRLRLMSSAGFTAPPLHATALAGVREAIVPTPRGTTLEKDQATIDVARQFVMEQSQGSPFALVIMLDATHPPYYMFPGETPFAPFPEEVEYHMLGDPALAPGLLNRYRNALHHVDALIGELIGELRRLDLFDSSVVLVTGDHGEAFFEHGVWGHNTAFFREQVDVPLVLHVPGVVPMVRRDLSRGVDVVPTLMELLGTKSEPSLYSSGRSLLHGPPARFAVACGWDECGVRDDNGFTTVFGISDESEVRFRVFDAQDRPTAAPPSPNFKTALAELHAFFR